MSILRKSPTKVEFKEAQVFWDQFFSSGEYRDNLKARILEGRAVHMETLLMQMAYGKPKETIALQGGGDGTFILVIGGVEHRRQVLDDGTVIEADGQVIEEEREERIALPEINGNGHA